MMGTKMRRITLGPKQPPTLPQEVIEKFYVKSEATAQNEEEKDRARRAKEGGEELLTPDEIVNLIGKDGNIAKDVNEEGGGFFLTSAGVPLTTVKLGQPSPEWIALAKKTIAESKGMKQVEELQKFMKTGVTQEESKGATKESTLPEKGSTSSQPQGEPEPPPTARETMQDVKEEPFLAPEKPPFLEPESPAPKGPSPAAGSGEAPGTQQGTAGSETRPLPEKGSMFGLVPDSDILDEQTRLNEARVTCPNPACGEKYPPGSLLCPACGLSKENIESPEVQKSRAEMECEICWY